ncbi:hypothetical protein A2630_04155 [Candidatus Woesebacteria bacterium RIFCSPHIGHO2_01_FULL_44_10]|uniref:Uncharacterized protein n=1 Tax=Candidatus Woesebacteria bacterium RIFCSPLOWO2_01_FULL_44_14 TaxID=1802525 RepID=A0A1F8C2Q6_9BACT|nr:MAG: hypothetical protein A2630_04155 [Candidatus Woesebacteria bacterium RIFCSPHIGHO2_01_FULL_44_10]OGM55463.1 MAG: hypothetical protein A3F62_00540 [Candidatus Woesebacteria bacterium RIFCSPHIGHO2_12_FULL_44_11]OGM70129.1 MAG: hypothetical protein A2975_03570 [Candidatus Woesebacteria bacterium RIFCSPLOWO2_01_FULL_44_14]
MSRQVGITIPASVVPDLEEWGRLTAKVFGEIRRYAGLKPKGIPEDQQWYWSRQWQEWERQADEDIAADRVRGFNNAEELIASLNA